MNFEKLTAKSQEAIQQAQTLSVRLGHQEVDLDHCASALLEADGGLVPKLLERMGVAVEALRSSVLEELRRRPSVSGPGAEAGKVLITAGLQRALVSAEDEAKRLKDEYISVEHLWLAILEGSSRTSLGQVMQRFGIARDRFLAALTEVRGNQRVTSANPEDAYEALEKYGVDLVDQARAGRLDPVIGRDAEIRRVIRCCRARPRTTRC
jgi:ATP-dependent Clp protease ATP-binding subunit ClpB